jgi:small subunit ribosomal protein S7
MGKIKKTEKSKFKFRSTQRFQRPDPRFNSMVVTKFINLLMWDGKKSVARKIFYDAMDILAKKVPDTDPLDTFHGAINNVIPQLEVRSRRVGGATYQVPMEVTRKRGQSLAIRQIMSTIRGRGGKPMAQRLADEIAAAYRKEGAAMSTRDQVHKMAEANKAFAHLSW